MMAEHGEARQCTRGICPVAELNRVPFQYNTHWVFHSIYHTSIVSHTRQRPFYGSLFVTTRVSRYQKKRSPKYHPDHPIFISFFHLPQSSISILPVQITCLAIFLHNLSPCPLWSTHPSDHSHLCSLKCHLIFTARHSYASAVLGVIILSVCPPDTHMLCD